MDLRLTDQVIVVIDEFVVATVIVVLCLVPALMLRPPRAVTA